MPWTRLHGLKDYYDMVKILDDYPEAKATFNLVPSLLVQIEDYVSGSAKDRNLVLTEKDPRELTEEEIIYMLKNFFMCNWEVMIKPYRRFQDLLLKRGRFSSSQELANVAKRMSYQELLDLQIWGTLAWFGFTYRKNDPIISALIKKEKNFSAQDKGNLLKKQKELLSLTIPKYKELADRGQIELTTSPFYHPILPLLTDTNSAKESMPYVHLPSVRYQHPEDAKKQIEMAIEYHQSRFGEKPQGMWPSEGSVSEQVQAIFGEMGIRWIATDEGVLSASFGLSRGLSPMELYKPYQLSGGTSIIFRNHFLSDQIGFVYQRWSPKEAAKDFMKNLHEVRASLPNDGRKYLVSVILDGENAWEYYYDGGEEFLREFYSALSSDPKIKTVRPRDFIAENPPESRINRLFAASWINTDFKIWIGHEEDNTAWEYLSKARTILEGSDNQLAWQELYIAEGSDWCWWYGDDHSSDNDDTFDLLFRKHIKNIYQLLGKDAPKYLDRPIKRGAAFSPTRDPVYYINPVIDGEITNYYEWLSAGYFDIEKSKGAMHQIETVLKSFYYGFSETHLYLRLDPQLNFSEDESKTFSFILLFYAPLEYKFELKYDAEKKKYGFTQYKLLENNSWEKTTTSEAFGIRRIIELGISFIELGVKAGDEIQFTIIVNKDGHELERWPRGGVVSITAPTSSYELEQWSA